MMRECQKPALVLLDEVGTGTDPEEGSALGVAIVDYFRRNCGAQVIASTHYRGLKIYAANDANVINASVEFNEKTLQPTYRLLVGLAGASSGIEIARRFGIRDDVIETARRKSGCFRAGSRKLSTQIAKRNKAGDRFTHCTRRRTRSRRSKIRPARNRSQKARKRKTKAI
ncbi:MAG: hypothetical protein WKF71_12735 [Pyrinomonadaceae bacterium]